MGGALDECVDDLCDCKCSRSDVCAGFHNAGGYHFHRCIMRCDARAIFYDEGNDEDELPCVEERKARDARANLSEDFTTGKCI